MTSLERRFAKCMTTYTGVLALKDVGHSPCLRGGVSVRSCQSSCIKNRCCASGVTRHFTQRLEAQLRQEQLSGRLFEADVHVRPVVFVHIDDFHLLAPYIRDGEVTLAMSYTRS